MAAVVSLEGVRRFDAVIVFKKCASLVAFMWIKLMYLTWSIRVCVEYFMSRLKCILAKIYWSYSSRNRVKLRKTFAAFITIFLIYYIHTYFLCIVLMLLSRPHLGHTLNIWQMCLCCLIKKQYMPKIHQCKIKLYMFLVHLKPPASSYNDTPLF